MIYSFDNIIIDTERYLLALKKFLYSWNIDKEGSKIVQNITGSSVL